MFILCSSLALIPVTQDQGQGALSERLRSFSMQDLTTIRGDGAPAPSGSPPPGTGRSSGKHGQPKMSRSASESAGSSGGGLSLTAPPPDSHSVYLLPHLQDPESCMGQMGNS
ncbi:receptor expression-enhancing protein 1 [Cricetulus griseus]|nr:receptor expression-enhancing protein 1 [Cricetulus griseus]